jgi:hypothetical protein
MTSIRTNCPQCGEVEMEARVVFLTVRSETGEGTYSFVCPVCETLVEKPADRKIVVLLRSAGVELSEAPSPEVLTMERVGDPPLTLDDLIDFHFLLERPDWFARLMASAE